MHIEVKVVSGGYWRVLLNSKQIVARGRLLCLCLDCRRLKDLYNIRVAPAQAGRVSLLGRDLWFRRN